MNDDTLQEIIGAEIDARGPMTFARFMELALYHPAHGYYASGRARIGRRGDFFTNVSVGPIFGKLLAAQFAEVWEKLGRPSDFTIVEQGAHDGTFAADVLGASQIPSLAYTIIEPFPRWRARQQETLARFPQVRWHTAIDELAPFTGVWFANELLDALPVRIFEQNQGGEISEVRVTRTSASDATPATTVTTTQAIAESVALGNINLGSEVLDDVAPGANALETAAPLLPFHLRPFPIDGVMKKRDTFPQFPALFSGWAERNSVADDAMRAVCQKLERGVALTIDYGFPRSQFFAAEHTHGTLQVRRQHRTLASPFEQIGSADISTHVDWTSVAKAAENAGARILGFTDQHHFLTGILSELIGPTDVESFSAADKRALQTLLHPEMLGRNFQALAVAKNFDGALAGFRFGGDARASLELTRDEA